MKLESWHNCQDTHCQPHSCCLCLGDGCGSIIHKRSRTCLGWPVLVHGRGGQPLLAGARSITRSVMRSLKITREHPPAMLLDPRGDLKRIFTGLGCTADSWLQAREPFENTGESEHEKKDLTTQWAAQNAIYKPFNWYASLSSGSQFPSFSCFSRCNGVLEVQSSFHVGILTWGKKAPRHPLHSSPLRHVQMQLSRELFLGWFLSSLQIWTPDSFCSSTKTDSMFMVFSSKSLKFTNTVSFQN